MPKKKSRKPKRKTSVSVRAKVSPLEQNVKHFEAEVNALGKQMRIKGEELGKRAEKRREKYRSTRHQAFGILGPLLSAVFGIACLSLGIWALDLIAQRSGTVIMSSGVRYFLLSNLWLFFLIFLASAFASYCSRACPHTYPLFSPFAGAFGISIFLWIFSSIALIDSARMGVPIIYAVAQYVGTHLLGIFWFFLLLGYFLLLLQLLVGTITGKDRCTSSGREHMRVPDYGVKSAQSVRSFRTIDSKRLYRSGKDRILGGVCGGIAEYFGVDPVLVRLIWVLAIFFFGTGILLYFVAWLIIPRNPDHKW